MSSVAPESDLMTVPEAAAALKVSPVTVSRWLRQGRLPAYRLGPRAVRIRRADLAAVFSPARERSTPAGAGSDAADPALGPAGGEVAWSLGDRADGGSGAPTVEDGLAALAAAAALRDQILTRRKGTPLPPLEADRKRGKRS